VNPVVHVHTVSSVSRPRSTIDPEAVAAAFAPDGLHGVSAAQVAARAGVAKPTLYAHGRSKEAVFLACVEAEVERLLDRLYAADVQTRELSIGVRAGAFALALIDHARAHPDAFRLLHVTARHRDSTVAAAVDGALDRVPAWIAAAFRRDVPRGAGGEDQAMVLAVALHGAAVALAMEAPWRRAERARLATLLGAALAAAAVPGAGDDDGEDSPEATAVGIY
jgi:AcrR family transcriptional regulator